ncbi:MAG: adenylate kinase [Acidimicrobiia bacterium]|nr:MAG: adenylate kinase [Acidimicrobiia bacterium]
MGRRVLFLGPPGAGKGTQAAMLATALGVPHVSTGAMLREAVAEGTELGKRADSIMAAGDLVPDDIVVAIVGERLARDDAACGYLLDGFPRNIAQAQALSETLGDDSVEVALLLTVDEDEIIDRLLKRAAEGRADDNEDTIRRRLEVYRRETEPMVAAYGDKVVTVEGAGAIDDVFAGVVRALV